ncbi:hypothetical protein [Amycolatopsis alba]|uniref:DUF3800 domain-containing protein n=1 Tax=Amycolatopsis alba DSM 44262 TaxID=1125972 RepID=A0A229RC15_AMYAL|nr:hypothetical protein [Amycolatopsis alba]OXM44213.1 hypothetical protein CFP75_35170 [Amycolatopsis alba DSM 44262]
MPVHAFIDESVRDQRYLLCMTLVAPAQLTPARRELTSLLLPGGRELHFKKEKEPRRRQLIDRIAALEVTTAIYLGSCTRKTEEDTRQKCLERAVTDLLAKNAHRLVLDSRDHRDVHDRGTLQRALGYRPSKTELTYEHLNSTAEPLLWISDAVGWCFGASGAWRRRTSRLIDSITEL